ncbi:hypothetical protein FRC18_011642 [Serendipita sp. 400]|nr:hypothetical protein FRC18_011642 [Serendipita sp. 400]
MKEGEWRGRPGSSEASKTIRHVRVVPIDPNDQIMQTRHTRGSPKIVKRRVFPLPHTCQCTLGTNKSLGSLHFGEKKTRAEKAVSYNQPRGMTSRQEREGEGGTKHQTPITYVQANRQPSSLRT